MKLLVLVSLLLEVSLCHDSSYFRQTSIIFSIASQDSPLETKCQLQLKEIKDAVLRKDIWAMKGWYFNSFCVNGYYHNCGLRAQCLSPDFVI